MSQIESTNQIQALSLSLQGLGIGVLLIFPALLSLEMFGGHFGFSFLPVTAIYFWPRGASYSWSLLGVFVFGLLYDMVSSSALGMWTLAFLILFMVMGGEISHKRGLVRAIGIFSLSVVLVLIIVFIVGRLSLGKWPQFYGLLGNALVSIIVFPVLYWIRSLYMALRGSSETLGIRG